MFGVLAPVGPEGVKVGFQRQTMLCFLKILKFQKQMSPHLLSILVFQIAFLRKQLIVYVETVLYDSEEKTEVAPHLLTYKTYLLLHEQLNTDSKTNPKQ